MSGFTETAIEQESQRRRTRIVLLDASQVVNQLIEGGNLIPKHQATELAGRIRTGFEHLDLDPHAEILAYERGWIWIIYYTHASVRTHFALIRSDGEVLTKTIADELIVLDRDCNGQLHSLRCLNPEVPVSDQSRCDEAISAYHQFVVSECGSIHLDGLPASEEVGSPQLESLFVPVYLDILPGPNAQKRKKKKSIVRLEGCFRNIHDWHCSRHLAVANPRCSSVSRWPIRTLSAAINPTTNFPLVTGSHSSFDARHSGHC